MRHINGAYTTYFNVKRSRSGHLFQGRYKAILVDADAYAKELSRYIHLNPVRAKMAEKPEEYKLINKLNHSIFKTPIYLLTEFATVDEVHEGLKKMTELLPNRPRR